MKILFDTSVLVAAMVEAHPMHERAWFWLKQARQGEFEFVVAAHTLAELYAVLTRLPVRPRISPGTAWRLVRENVLSRASVVALSRSHYTRLLQRLSEQGIAGGLVYDALIAQAAEVARVQRLLTLDPSDFRRVWPEGADRITVP